MNLTYVTSATFDRAVELRAEIEAARERLEAAKTLKEKANVKQEIAHMIAARRALLGV
jgi:hypothetical protein